MFLASLCSASFSMSLALSLSLFLSLYVCVSHTLSFARYVSLSLSHSLCLSLCLSLSLSLAMSLYVSLSPSLCLSLCLSLSHSLSLAMSLSPSMSLSMSLALYVSLCLSLSLSLSLTVSLSLSLTLSLSVSLYVSRSLSRYVSLYVSLSHSDHQISSNNETFQLYTYFHTTMRIGIKENYVKNNEALTHATLHPINAIKPRKKQSTTPWNSVICNLLHFQSKRPSPVCVFLCVWEAGWGPNPPVISSRALDDGGGCVRQSRVIMWALASPSPSLPLAVTRLVLRRSVWQIRWILSCRACWE